MPRDRHETLMSELERIKASGAITDFSHDTQGRRHVWTLTIPTPAGESDVELPTREAEAFIRGVDALTASRARSENPVREAIYAHGRVEVELEDPSDAAAVKRTRNAVFAAAYALGLKGKFRVRTVDDTVFGWRTDVAEDLTPELVAG